MTTKAYAAQSATAPLAPHSFARREPLPTDVRDRHPVLRGVPLRPAHRPQRVGRVSRPCTRASRATRSSAGSTAVGAAVTKFKAGDLAASGAWSIRAAPAASCKRRAGAVLRRGGTVFTYNSPDPHGPPRSPYGGYSDKIVVDEALRPPRLRQARPGGGRPAAVRRHHHCTRRCKHWEVGPGKKVGSRRPRRARAHGGEVRPRARGARRCCSPPRREGGGRQAARGGRGGGVEGRRRDEEARRQLRLHREHACRRRTTSTRSSRCSSPGRRRWCWSARPSTPLPVGRVPACCSAAEVASPGRAIGGIAETQEMLDFCASTGSSRRRGDPDPEDQRGLRAAAARAT